MTLRRKKAPFGGGLVVVGGQCRKVGKTALVVDLIRAFPRAHWTAVKITPYTEAECPVRGAGCGCTAKQHTFAIRAESDRSGETDTSRFLVAGAERALWVQTKEGRLADALAPLAALLAEAGNVIVESDAIVRFWKPDLFLTVLDPRNEDFKASARAVRRFADAFVARSRGRSLGRAGRAKGNATGAKSGRTTFFQPLGLRLPKSVQEFVSQCLSTRGHLI
jgi:hypothetical protein